MLSFAATFRLFTLIYTFLGNKNFVNYTGLVLLCLTKWQMQYKNQVVQQPKENVKKKQAANLVIYTT